MMFAKALKLVGLWKAPKATAMLLHPIRGTKAILAVKGFKGLFTTRSGAMLGVMLAVPLGLGAFVKRAFR